MKKIIIFLILNSVCVSSFAMEEDSEFITVNNDSSKRGIPFIKDILLKENIEYIAWLRNARNGAVNEKGFFSRSKIIIAQHLGLHLEKEQDYKDCLARLVRDNQDAYINYLGIRIVGNHFDRTNPEHLNRVRAVEADEVKTSLHQLFVDTKLRLDKATKQHLEVLQFGALSDKFKDGYELAHNVLLPWGTCPKYYWFGPQEPQTVDNVEFKDLVTVDNLFCILRPDHTQASTLKLIQAIEVQASEYESLSVSTGVIAWLLRFNEITISRFVDKEKNRIECGLPQESIRLLQSKLNVKGILEFYQCLLWIINNRDFVTKQICADEHGLTAVGPAIPSSEYDIL